MAQSNLCTLILSYTYLASSNSSTHLLTHKANASNSKHILVKHYVSFYLDIIANM